MLIYQFHDRVEDIYIHAFGQWEVHRNIIQSRDLRTNRILFG